MVFQWEQFSIIVITLVLSMMMIWAGKKLGDTESARPGRFLTLLVQYVEFIRNFTVSNMGKKLGEPMSAYIGTIFIYILISNMSGLVGLEPPTSSLSVTLVLSLITWLMIQITSIRSNGWKGYIGGFFEPFFFFVIPNIFGQIAPAISLAVRLFGNVLSGGIITGMIYSATAWLLSHIPIIGGFNWLGAIVTPALHFYFDIFAGFLQAFIFVSLTTIFIGVEYSDPEAEK